MSTKQEIIDGATQVITAHLAYESYVNPERVAHDLADLNLLTPGTLTPVYSYDVWCGDHWAPMDHEFDSLQSARDWLSTRERRAEARIITRHVTEWEEVE